MAQNTFLQLEALNTSNEFVARHIGPSAQDIDTMLQTVGYKDLEEVARAVVPKNIFQSEELKLPESLSEDQMLMELRSMAKKNQVYKNYLGMGYYPCIMPAVIQRNIFENPGWYTQYTPYQAEIAQGRLEALLNFQTMVADLTGLPCANASLLDEGTAAAEAMAFCHAANPGAPLRFILDGGCHPQTIEVVKTRAMALGVEILVKDLSAVDWEHIDCLGVLLQYPSTDGAVHDYRKTIERAHARDAMVVMATDLLALTSLVPPGELGADVAVGSAQRFGVPMGYGGPHAAFFSTLDKYKRLLPGRIVGVSKDSRGKSALRLAMQTREQHIRREKATSNICTAQVLLAVLASMYAVYHGPKGLKKIAQRVHSLASLFAQGVKELGLRVVHNQFFDTVAVDVGVGVAESVVKKAAAQRLNVRPLSADRISCSFSETTTVADVEELWRVLATQKNLRAHDLTAAAAWQWADSLQRQSPYLQHPVFNSYHSETEMLRYMRRLEGRDLALNHSMIALGSCTMKLNGTTEMVALSWPEFAELHPFAPLEQTAGFQQIFSELSDMIAQITGFSGVSLQPNAGSQGELAGLLVIRRYHEERGDHQRKVCLIPQSAHGTNPASAVMAGMRVVVVACDEKGNIDVNDLRTKATEHAQTLAALMVTYPSTHGVFEESIQEICRIVHQAGGQVYMDGANLNAQVGLTSPAKMGADVCHLNLHKTFAIPHGGGGPGMGPIAVAKHLDAYLPGHPIVRVGGDKAVGCVSAAPWGSSLILIISYVYMRLMGGAGLRKATQVAILSANYMAKRLESHYPILYRGQGGLVAHEFIADLRGLKETSGIEVEDVAKRLMDFGFHAPTMSFPVAGTMMIEPTESESKAELDRFCEAMIAIRQEIEAVATGKLDRQNNPLKNAPHTADVVCNTEWNRPYRREQGAYPASYLREGKYWPPVSRIDNVYGDRNVVCTCPPLDSYT